MGIKDQNLTGETIDVLAKFYVLTNKDGGNRKRGIKSGYRPNHVFGLTVSKPQKTFMGEITFDDPEWIYPGEERIVNVKFINYEGLGELLQEGREWSIYEYPNLIAKAVILKVINQSTT